MSQNTSDEMPRGRTEAVLVVTARRRVLTAPQAYIEVPAVAYASWPAERLRRERRGEPSPHGKLLDARLEGVRAVGRREASFRLERDLELACAELVRIATLGTNPVEGHRSMPAPYSQFMVRTSTPTAAICSATA